jgi:hypothetical protein
MYGSLYLALFSADLGFLCSSFHPQFAPMAAVFVLFCCVVTVCFVGHLLRKLPNTWAFPFSHDRDFTHIWVKMGTVVQWE